MKSRKKIIRNQLQNSIRRFSRHLLENQHLLLDRTDHLFFTRLNLARAEDILGEEDKARENYKKLLEMIDNTESKTNLNYQYIRAMAAVALSGIYARNNENGKAIEILEFVWRDIISNLKSNSDSVNGLRIGAPESDVGINLYFLYEKNKIQEKSKSLKAELDQYVYDFQFKEEDKLEK